MNVPKVIDAAADHIEVFGHWKNDGYGPGDNTSTAPACIIGAIHVCTDDEDLQRSAHRAVRNYLGRVGIVGWNDAPERTAEEVIATLRAVSVVVSARESQPAAVSA